MVDQRRIDLRHHHFPEDEYGQGDGARVENLPDVVKTRVSDHAVIGAVDEKHDDVDNHHDEDSVPTAEHDSFVEVVVMDKKHGYQVRHKQHHDIKSQHPYAREGITGLFSK